MRILAKNLVRAAVVVLSTSVMAFACPFCGPAQSPLGEKLAKSDVVVLAKWIKTTPAKGASQGSTKFVVVEQLGGQKKELKFAAGDDITFPREWRANPDDRCVLFGFEVDELTWETPQPVTDAAIKYMREAPPFDRPIGERLNFFAKHIESPDPLIAMDVFAEFGCAPFADVAALKPKLDRDRIRDIVASDKTPAARLGLYGMMLGLCGTESDAKLLRERLDRPQKDIYLLGLDGMTFGYLMLAGTAGLDDLDRTKLTPDEQNNNHAYATMAAMRVLWSEGQGRIPRDRLKQSMRQLLTHPLLADQAVADLARWEDWTVMDRLVELDSRSGDDDPRLRRAIIRYLLTATGRQSKREPIGKLPTTIEPVKVERPGESEIPQAVQQQAKKHLETFRQRDPKLVASEERFYGS